VWRQVGVTLTSAWTITLALVGVVWWAIDTISSVVAGFVGIVDAIVFPAQHAATSGPLTYWLSVANTFMPVSETMAFLVGYLALVMALTTYRLVKSWIPTLS